MPKDFSNASIFCLIESLKSSNTFAKSPLNWVIAGRERDWPNPINFSRKVP